MCVVCDSCCPEGKKYRFNLFCRPLIWHVVYHWNDCIQLIYAVETVQENNAGVFFVFAFSPYLSVAWCWLLLELHVTGWHSFFVFYVMKSTAWPELSTLKCVKHACSLCNQIADGCDLHCTCGSNKNHANLSVDISVLECILIIHSVVSPVLPFFLIHKRCFIS